MKVKEITKRGEVRYLVDGKVKGTRQRMFFDTKPQAERWLKAEQQDTTAAIVVSRRCFICLQLSILHLFCRTDQLF
jgi:hypothetical protein